MKKMLLAAFAALLALVACDRFQEFTFVQLSDTQIGFIDDSPQFTHSDSLMKAAVDAVNALDPALVVITGDLVNEPYNPVQDSVYRVRKAELQPPVYEVPGNHDILPYSEENHAHYLELRGYDRFCFREKGCAFIGIDSNCIVDGAGEAEEEQLRWLADALASARKARYTFVFLHCPIVRERADEPSDHFNFPVGKREKYLTLFKENGVDAVFAGHCHQDWTGSYEGMGLYTAGPVCNALGHGTPGYNVVKVTRKGVSVQYVPTPGVDPTHCRF